MSNKKIMCSVKINEEIAEQLNYLRRARNDFPSKSQIVRECIAKEYERNAHKPLVDGENAI